MAKRDPDFREQVLKLDGYYCVICGFDGREESDRKFLHAHHVERRGAGGDPSKDIVENGMTLCAKCHGLETDRHIIIDNWNRNDLENGLIVRRENGEEIPKDELWFYRGQDKMLVEASIQALKDLSHASAAKARIMANIWKYYDLTDSVSPKQLVASLGLDAVEAEKEAKAYIKLEYFGLHWPDGVNLSKVNLIIKCLDGFEGDITPDLLSGIQKILDSAQHESYTNLIRDLESAQLLPSKQKSRLLRKFYVFIPRKVFLGECKIYLANEEEIVEKETSDIKIRVGKFYHPLRKWGERLMIENGLLDEKIKVRSLEE